MKKFFVFLAVIGFTALSAQYAAAQDAETAAPAEEAVAAQSVDPFNAPAEEVPFHQALKTKFIEGGAGFMSLVIICLILGLAIAIERILYLESFICPFQRPTPRNSLRRLRMLLQKVGLKLQKKFAATPADLSQAFSTRVFSVWTRALRLLRKLSFPTVQFR